LCSYWEGYKKKYDYPQVDLNDLFDVWANSWFYNKLMLINSASEKIIKFYIKSGYSYFVTTFFLFNFNIIYW
jgi:hypothetical protein